MAEQFKRETFRFQHGGVDLAHPIDAVPPIRYVILNNIRSYFESALTVRPGLTLIASLGTKVHSIKRLNDLIAASNVRLVGSGSSLIDGSGTTLATGFSGNPLTFVLAAPKQTSKPWAYIGDSSKLVKTKVGAATASNWGSSAPANSPFVTYGTPAFKTLNNGDTPGDWTPGGTAGSASGQTRINTTIANVAFDSGSSGWASISPSATDGINEGILVKVNGSEVLIQEVIPAAAATTVAAIVYDSGSSGDCSILLTANVNRNTLTKGSLLTIGGEDVAVKEVIWGADGIPSIRVTTSGTISAGSGVTGRACFRSFVFGASVGNSITSDAVKSTVDTGIGFLDFVSAIDASNAGGRPIDLEKDEAHLSLLVADLTLLTEAKLYIDIGSGDFTENYLMKAVEPNDFVPVTADTLTVLQARINRLQNKLKKAVQNGNFDRAERLRDRIANLETKFQGIQDSTPIESQTTLGANQWTELRVKLKDFLRVGSDPNLSLGTIAAVRVQVNVTASVDIQIDSIWLGGTYGPDVGNNLQGYQYMYRYRSSETGATSAWSAISWTPVYPHREAISLTPTVSSDGQIDKIDYARFGGALLDWRIIGTGPNSGSFIDGDLDEDILESIEPVDFSIFQPFPVTDVPKTGNCTIAGVGVQRTSGDIFDIRWARGTIIIVGNIPCTIHSVISSSVLLLNESVNATSGSFYIPAPLITGSPLPSVFGPVGYGETGVFIFGCGSSLQPGTLFWTTGNDPDTCHDYNTLEVCPPSEPLVGGVVHDGRGFVFSTERMFEIFPNFSSDRLAFVTQEIPNSNGMLGQTQNTAICAGPKIWFRGKDGIYETDGGLPVNITNETLYGFFPHDGQAGSTLQGYAPPDDTKAQNLEFYDGILYYDYVDTNSNSNTLIYDTIYKRWSFDVYNTVKPLVHYGEEGSDIHSLLVGGSTSGTGKLWQQSGTSDDGNAIAGHVRTFAFDAGDPRAKKSFGDAIIDADPSTATLSIVIGFDNYASLEAAQTMSGAGRAQKILDIQSGNGFLGKNEALDITWSSTTASPILYLWQTAYIPKPEDTTIRATDPDDLGTPHAKWVQGFRIHCNTFNVQKTIKVQKDTGTNGAWVDAQAFDITSNGESIQAFSFDNAFITHLIRIVTVDTDPWELFSYQFEFNLEPELVEEWEGQQTAHGLRGYQHLKGLYVTHLSTANLSLILTADGVAQSAITIAHSAGLRKKTWVPIPALKYKVLQYKITSSQGFRLYTADSEARVKDWGNTSAYVVTNPFGDSSYDRGIRM